MRIRLTKDFHFVGYRVLCESDDGKVTVCLTINFLHGHQTMQFLNKRDQIPLKLNRRRIFHQKLSHV